MQSHVFFIDRQAVKNEPESAEKDAIN